MSKIDLSKAKTGDKFRTRAGYIVELEDTVLYLGEYVYRLTSPRAFVCVLQNGKIYKDNKESEYDLVEQVFDDEKDTTDLEIVEAMNQAIKEIPEKAAEREQELQRRQEVVKLADRIFFSERGSAYSFKDCIEVAEHSVNMINQYIKEGKL